MTTEGKIWLLISKAISGDISTEELEEMELTFLAHPELRTDYENIKRLRMTHPGALTIDERRAMDRGLEKFDHALTNESGFAEWPLFNNYRLEPLQRSTHKSWMVAASVITVLMLSVLAGYVLKSKKVAQQQVLAAHYGKHIHTTLPDGSTVWLNSGSSIKYAENFEENEKREITLNGEAYFDVKHDVKHPFIVHAGKLNVVVLGTAFNVKAYPTDAFMETTLIRGKVEIVNDARPGANIVLYPNQKVTVNTSEYTVKKITLINKQIIKDSVALVAEKGNAIPAMPNSTIEETAWINNRLTFKRQDFAELATQLERWYDVKIIFDDGKYLNKQFTGTFKDQDINEVMHALQLTQTFHYTITNNQIHIW
jgi:ferric-dicitrate binding protein FerR (iron transport regulator)